MKHFVGGGIVFCKMHGVVFHVIDTKLHQFLHLITPLEWVSFENEHPLTPLSLNAYFQSSPLLNHYPTPKHCKVENLTTKIK